MRKRTASTRADWIGPVAVGGVMLGALWLAGRGANPGPIGFRLDDAWIHLVYGRALFEEQAFAYNPGMPTSGCTSPLWAIVLAVLHAVFGRGDTLDPLIASVFAVGAAFHLAAIAAATALARDASGSRWAGALAGLLVACATPWAAASFSGMEVTLAGLLLLLGVRAELWGSWRMAGVWLGAAFLARPESAAVTGVVFAFALTRAARREIAWLLVPAALAAIAVGYHHMAATGSPWPATFAGKRVLTLVNLPTRLEDALLGIFGKIPPWGAGLGWIALLGFLPGVSQRGRGTSWLPFAAGAAYVLANVAIIDPVDPAAFYHVRYLLPAVPLLLAGIAIGAHRVGDRFGARLRHTLTVALAVVALVQAAMSTPGESRHFHNDVRNINEVQRRIGEWMGANVAPGTWIASSDAGAIRYVSRLPTIDVLGLNTPELQGRGRVSREEFVRAHPVAALAILPAWFRPEDSRGLDVAFEAETKDYTVTSNPQMGTQVVIVADTSAVASGTPVRARFRGYRTFEVDLVAAGAAGATSGEASPLSPSRGAP